MTCFHRCVPLLLALALLVPAANLAQAAVAETGTITGKVLDANGKPVKGSKVLILGLAYKPNVDDDRESPSYVLLDLLKTRGALLAYYDPYVPVIRPTREHPHWAGTKSIAWNKENLSGYDAVLLATNHASVNYQELADWAPCIIDSRNALVSIKTKPDQVWKA